MSGEFRRNRDPQAVRVMSCADFAGDMSLDDKTEAMIENRNEIAIHNVEYLLNLHHISQAQMCTVDLEGSPKASQMATYKKVGRDIPFRTVARIGMRYGYTPEQMYGQILDKADKTQPKQKSPVVIRPLEEYQKYLGTYYMAYFSTDARLGANKRTTARALNYGMLSVYPGAVVDGVPTLHVCAYTYCSREEMNRLETLTRNAEAVGNPGAVSDCYDTIAWEGELPKLKYLYRGEMILTERTARILLNQVSGSDVVEMELHNRAANSSQGSLYKGGLATMMSTSRGQEHMPCIQAAILSRKSFENKAREEVAELLFLEPPKVELQQATKAIVTYFEALFPEDNVENPLSQLSDEDKAFLLDSYIEKKLGEVIKRNVLGYYKVSTEMDAKVYRTLCR